MLFADIYLTAGHLFYLIAGHLFILFINLTARNLFNRRTFIYSVVRWTFIYSVVRRTFVNIFSETSVLSSDIFPRLWCWTIN